METKCGHKQAICIGFYGFQKRESIGSVNLTATAVAAVNAFLIFSGTHETVNVVPPNRAYQSEWKCKIHYLLFLVPKGHCDVAKYAA